VCACAARRARTPCHDGPARNEVARREWGASFRSIRNTPALPPRRNSHSALCAGHGADGPNARGAHTPSLSASIVRAAALDSEAL